MPPIASRSLELDGTAIRVAALPVVPGAHQGVLQDRQLVHVVADVVEQALHQARRDAPTAHADGAGDHRLQLVAGQARDQVLAVADRLGQVAEARAVAEEVRAHGDDDVHRHVGLLRRFEQQLDEGRRFISGVRTLWNRGLQHLSAPLDGTTHPEQRRARPATSHPKLSEVFSR